MRCAHCGTELNPEDRFCCECGAPCPQPFPEPSRRVPPRFAESERRFATLRARYQAGELNDEAYEAELHRLMVEDGAGDYWMLGADSGEWYWYDGERWLRRDPGLHERAAELVPPAPRAAAQAPPLPTPSAFALWKWAVAGLGGLIALLILAGGGMLIARRGRLPFAPASLATEPAVAVAAVETPVAVVVTTTLVPDPTLRREGTSSLMPEITSTATRQPTLTAVPTATPVPTPTPTASPAVPFSIRPYDGDRDADVGSLLERVDDFVALAGPGERQWKVTFPVDAPVLLDMSWCAVDQSTLDDNWSHLAHELSVDGFPIQLSQLAEMTWTSGELLCRGYKGVLTGWGPEPHSVQWTRHLSREINDGFVTYAAGDYRLRFEVEMVRVLHEEFNDVSGGWIEGDYESDRVWIEDGEYHVLLKAPQRVAAIAHSEDRYADFYLLAQARQVGEVGGEYGVVFRYQDPQNTYYFRISHNGRYRIGKRVDGQWIDLVEWTSSDTIHQGSLGNALWLVCDGHSLTAYINSQEVARLTDDAFADGYVGVMAGSFDQPDVHVAFDSLTAEAMSGD